MEIRNYSTYNEKEILKLYSSVGWTAYTDEPQALKLGFQNSLLVLAAYEGEELLGIIRVVGDGVTVMAGSSFLAAEIRTIVQTK